MAGAPASPASSRRSSVLVRSSVATHPTAAGAGFRALFLHDRGGQACDGAPMLGRLGVAAGIALQAARPLNPLTSNADLAAAHRGYRWWIDDPDGRPDPASFGDSLAQLAEALEELCEEQPGNWLLAGSGQGGAMAMALAVVASDLLAGVVVDGTGWAAPSAWNPPAPSDAPPMLIAPSAAREGAPAAGDLAPLGPLAVARVTILDVPIEQARPADVQAWLASLTPASHATLQGNRTHAHDS